MTRIMKAQTPQRILTLLAATALAVSPAMAVDYTWQSASNSPFSTAGNWSPAGGPPGAADSVIGATSFGQVQIDGTYTITDFTYNGNNAWQWGTDTTTGRSLTITGDLNRADPGSGNALQFLRVGAGTLTVSIQGNATLGGTVNFGVNGAALSGLTVTGLTTLTSTRQLIVNSANAAFNGGISFTGNALFSVLGQTGTTINGPVSTAFLSGSLAGSTVQANTLAATATASQAATLTINGNTGATHTFAGVIRNTQNPSGTNTATLGITKTGTNTQIFSGANTYTGATLVSGGTLIFDGTHSGTGSITVESGATFGRTVTASAINLGGNLTIEDGGRITLSLAPGFTNSTLNRTGGTWSFDTDQAFTFNDLGAAVGTYTGLITGLTGSEAGLASIASWTITNAGWAGTFSYNSGSVDLNLTAIPEPGTWGLLAAGLAALVIFRRRR